MNPKQPNPVVRTVGRVQIIYVALIFIICFYAVRLFYIQVIRYNYYHTQALSDQLKEDQVPATRGIIEAYQGNSIVPIVLNQKLYTLFADPLLIENPAKSANKIAVAIGGSVATYTQQLNTKSTQYVILANKLTQAQSDKILSYQFPGIGTQGQDYRVYPDGGLASQVLGFVNNAGQGQYGVEQALNPELTGVPGQLKAITAANGVPLAASNNNIEVNPINGNNVVLTIDTGMQSQMEEILAQEYKKTNSQGLSAIIMDPNTGQIKAMANYPSYSEANYQQVTDPSVFQNAAVDNAIEPGSSIKTLTTSAALNQGVIQPNESFYDPAHWIVDGFNITDIEQDGGPREQNIASILSLSLNTGATWMLMQMSQPGGTQITEKGITAWNNYMLNHFRLGQTTGIEQGYESAGYVPPNDPIDPSLSLTYANTAFGQGVTVTALQMAAALSSIVNGGTYYKPTLVSQIISPSGHVSINKPKILEHDVVAPKVGQELIPLMQNVVNVYFHEGYSFMNFGSNYLVGGKTGTAQVAQPGGGYYANIYNGTYVGFVGTTKPQYVIVVFNIKPNVPGYAGALGGQPVFADLAHMLINEGYVAPNN
jgi:stage V sporulation protein D (sporulation-specific penicillin-binding protein)